MVVRISFAPHHLRSKMTERILEPLRRSDARESTDGLAAKPVQGKLLPAPDVLQHPGRMIAFDDLSGGVVPADLLLDRRDIALALREEDDVGATDVPGRFAEDPSRQQIAVAERIRRIDKHHLDRVLQLLILETVIKDQGVATEPLHRVTARLYAVAVDDDRDTRQV